MILEAIFAVGTLVLTELARYTAREVIRSWVHASKKPKPANNPPKNGHSSPPSTQEIKNDLETIDVEVVDLEKKEKRDRGLSQRDKERQQELEDLRKEKFQEFQDQRKDEIAEEQINNPDDFATSQVDNSRVHILQFHMGQVVLEKKCHRCGRPMILLSKTRLDGSLYELNDFFWSCIGYFNEEKIQCKEKQRFLTKDIGLLHKANVLEFQISNEDLSLIFHQKPVEQAVTKRLKEHIAEKDDGIFCPIHYVPMTLREKKNHDGHALDMYHLRCPHPGCQQTVKLKSPAQIAAYLSRKEGRGIL